MNTMDNYKTYLQKWIEEKHQDGDSPLCYQQWEQLDYFSKAPSGKEWNELQDIYNHLTDIAKEIEEIRIKLYTNRAHRNLNSDNWEHLDEVLFNIQSKIWSNTDDGFGSAELSSWCY